MSFSKSCCSSLNRFTRIQRFFSYQTQNPQRGAGRQGGTSIFPLAVVLASVGGAAYVYKDPDILPISIRRFLPVQEPEGHSMTLEEYENWRLSQGNYPTSLPPITISQDSASKIETKEGASSSDITPDEQDCTIEPSTETSEEEMKKSLQKLLLETREQESAFLVSLDKGNITDEEALQAESYKEEKSRIKKQLKFIKSMK